MTSNKNTKKVVKVDAPVAKENGPVWAPTAGAKSKATTLRLVSWVLWTAAILAEVAAIIWLLPMANEKLWPLLVVLVPIAVFAIVANILWKKANRLSPASKKNAFMFFVQNQLGAIMTIIAFLPLIIFVLLDKNLDGKQKGIVGGIAAVAMVLIAVFSGISWDGGPSQEQYAEEENIMMLLTGEDEVYWVKSGKVFHVCAEVPDVNKASQDGQIYSGTVAAAHEAGKDRLTLKWESEALNHCGYTQSDIDRVKEGISAETPDSEDADAEDADSEDNDAEGTEEADGVEADDLEDADEE